MRQRKDKKSRIEVIKERLNDSKEEYISHFISCELQDDRDGMDSVIYIDDEKQEEIKILLEYAKESQIKNLNFLSKVICDSIIRDVILFNGNRQKVYKKIKDVLENQDKIYLGYKKYWRRELDSLSSIYEEREIVKWEKEITSCKVSIMINNIERKTDYKLIARIDTAEKEIKRNQEELIRMGLKTLFSILFDNGCMKDLEEYPGEYCEFCKFNYHEPEVGIFHQCMREE